MKPDEVPMPSWKFIALTYYPDGKERRGEVKAHTLKGALQLVHQQKLFAISIGLKNLKIGKFAQDMATTQAVVDRLKREGVEAKLVEEGKIVMIAKAPEK